MSNLPAIVDAQLEGAADIGRTWTETMLEMAEWIGTEATRQLIDHFGGTEIYVPMTMPGNHPIVDAIGFDSAQKLAEIYGRERIELPAARRALAAFDRAQVLAEVRAGRLTKKAAARRLLTSTRYIRHLINGPQAEPKATRQLAARSNQLDLLAWADPQQRADNDPESSS